MPHGIVAPEKIRARPCLAYADLMPCGRNGEEVAALPDTAQKPAATSTEGPASAVSIRGLCKRFGDFTAVDDISIDVSHGELLALLGPSGCGKTTTLRMVAGLERPSAGRIAFRDQVFVSVQEHINLSPEKRNIGMVFQSYGLWPHMTVFENVAYPLQLRRCKKSEIEQRVHAILVLMGLAKLARQPVPHLSGGQQQRVALARALVYEPALILFDEPFSNLDTKLRSQMRLELKTLRRKVAMTGFFVTHDQIEALSLADRIAIMNHGRIEQVGTPRDVYELPRTPFVRDFLGQAVKLNGTLERAGTQLLVRVSAAEGADSVFAVADAFRDGDFAGDSVEIAIRPEFVRVLRVGDIPPTNAAAAVIEELLFTGERYEAKLRIGRQSALLVLPSDAGWCEGDTLGLVFPQDKISLWPRPALAEQ